MSVLLQRAPRTERASNPALRKVVITDLDRPDTYPTLSDTTIKVMGLANKADVSVGEIAGIVRRDGVLAAGVLRAANSCTFRGGKAIEDVQQAVLRLALQQCGRLLATSGVREVYARCSPPVQKRCDAVLRHSLFVAQLAARFSRLAGVGEPGAAFTAGLLHDIGRVILCVKCDGVADPDAVAVHEGDETVAVEREAFGIDHCAIGYQFATRSGLPESVVRVALNHHRAADEPFQREAVALVAVAERVANHVQRAHEIAGYDLAACPQFEVLAARWKPAREVAFRAGLPAATVQALRDTRKMLRALA